MNSQNKFSVISTFSGCGGSSLGYKKAGGKILLAVEMEDHAVETYKLNFPETPVFHGDIHNLKVKDILRKCNLQVGELDIFDGSPPCQGFSTSGKRDLCDPRNQLYNEYIRILRGLQPKTFVMENVSGMVQGKMKYIFVDILKQLKASGYKVKARLMNAMYYDVPQNRKRMIFIGVRDDLCVEPSHPKPHTKPIPVGKALKDVEPEFIKYSNNKFVKSILPKVKEGEKLSNYHPNGSYFNYIKLDLNKPSPTITKNGFKQMFHKSGRIVTINEAKRLASFPDNFKFTGSYEKQWERIGNSVPPNLMKAIARHIHKHILSN